MAINVIPRNQELYLEIVKDFWRKECEVNRNESPAYNNSGNKDRNINSAGQQFFYLSWSERGPRNRVCDVPHGKGLLIPIVSVIVSDKERPGASDRDLHQLVDQDQKYTDDPFVELDDIRFDLTGFDPVHTDVFEVNYPNNAIWDDHTHPPYPISPGRSKAVAGGHYLLTAPLTPGRHTVRFGGKVEVPDKEDCIERFYDENVEYTLNVQSSLPL
jgi:hypothetical protein